MTDFYCTHGPGCDKTLHRIAFALFLIGLAFAAVDVAAICYLVVAA